MTGTGILGEVPTTTPVPLPYRTARVLAATILGLGLLAGCGNDDVDCGLDACAVTIDRSVDAQVDVLGVQAKFIGADGDKVTLEVAGERVQLTVGQQATQVAGLQVSLDGVTQDAVKVRIAR